jgi:HPt (histidine-containing phosphotransfer) domain-containing protein
MDGEAIDRDALKRLLELLGSDPAELGDLLDDYNEDAPALARRIMDAAEHGDLDALRIAAHTLKSNARDFGALRLSALCAELERASASGNPTDPRRAAEEISRAEEEARRALAEIRLDELPPEAPPS